MNVSENTDQKKLISLIKGSKQIAVVPSKIAGADAFAAAVGLYYILRGLGNAVSLIHPGRVPEHCDGLIPSEEICSNTLHRDLTVSIDYSGTDASKGYYATSNDVLQFTLSPVPKSFERSRIKTTVTGFDFDLVFMIGAQSVGDLGQTYENLREKFERSKIINIDNTNMNLRHGYANVIDTRAKTLSHLIFKLAHVWGLAPNDKAARALLVGMTYRVPKS